MAAFQLALLGSYQLSVAGALVAQFPTAKVQALLAYLAVEVQTPHARDTLIGLLWPDYTPESARHNFRQTLFRLRQVIPPAHLLVTNQTVQFNSASEYRLDVTTFTELITACRRHAHAHPSACADCIERLQQAVELYRGEFLAGFFLDDCPAFEEWILLKREWLRRQALQAFFDLAVYYERQEAYARAEVYAWRQVELDPPREEAHQQLMRVLALSGRRSEALAQYASCRRLLAEELGVEPGAETIALYERIRSDAFPDKATGGQRAPQGDKVNASPSHPVTLPLPHPVTLSSPTLAEWKEITIESTPFVARERELALLHEHLGKTLAGNGQVVFVVGEAGSGKTGLLREFAWRAQSVTGELLVTSGHCQAQSGLGDPYLPFRHVLRLLTGELDLPSAQTLLNRLHASRLASQAPLAGQVLLEDGPDLVNIFVPGPALLSRLTSQMDHSTGWLRRLEQRVQRGDASLAGPGPSDLFEQYSKVLFQMARCQPLLLLVDDLHWADAASLSLLFHLGRQLTHNRILLVGAYRSEDVAIGRGNERHPLEPIVNELKRQYGEIVIDLDQAQGRTFVEAWLDTQSNRLGPGFRTMLYRHTQGKPLFTLELLRTMRERGDLVRDDTGQWMASPALNWRRLPARVEAVIEERIARLPEELRQTLAVASVEGEVFTAQVVARVQGLQERPLLQRLSRELEKRHRLVRRQADVQVEHKLLTRCQFTHALFQQYLYNELGAGERRLLHSEIAGALAEVYQERIDEVTAQLAHHYAEAGDTAKAIEYLLQAGDRARMLYADQEAIAAYQRALDFLKEQGNYERAARTLMKLGQTYHLAFDFPRAQAAYEESFELWQRATQLQPESLPSAPHALRISGGEPLTLDPAVVWEGETGLFISQLFSGLLTLSPDLDIAPDLARTWEVLEGGRKYVFHLRNDASWSDGTPLTAGDFVYAWQRVLKSATTDYTILFYDIQGARALHEGRLTDPDQIGVRALDAWTLEMELEEPTSYFLHLLTFCPTYPVPRHVVERHGPAWTEVEHLVSNGPFRLDAWQRGQSMQFSRNPRYHGQFTGNVHQVQVSCIAQWGDKLALYEAGGLDVLPGFQPTEFIRARQRLGADLVMAPILITLWVGFDRTRAPFADVRVRQALAYATDREALANQVMHGWVTAATGGVVPPGMPGHSPGIALPFDPQRARQLLAAAGYPGGRGLPRLNLLGLANLKPELEFMQAQWREILGIELDLAAEDWKTYFERANQEPFSLSVMGWGAEYPDPHSILAGWRNDALAGLLEQARRTMNQTERLKLYAQADRLAVEEVAILPLVYIRSMQFIKPWVKKFPLSPIPKWFWKDVIIEPH
jgi:ABC-type oligopeptide transport system substrate-binding subunit/DNA-binding SARP family transcriptional activator